MLRDQFIAALRTAGVAHLKMAMGRLIVSDAEGHTTMLTNEELETLLGAAAEPATE